MRIEYLPWDSDFFKKKIGKVSINNGEIIDVDLLGKQAYEDDYKLLYLFSDNDLQLIDRYSETIHVELVDKKVVYDRIVKPKDKSNDSLPQYTASNISEELENLAYLSGQHSRFRIDSNFTDADFFKLYKTWITKSVSKEIADIIFIAEESDKIVGMVTLKMNDKIGHIGLIAFSSETQSRGYGQKLINSCFNLLLEKDIDYIEVPTQMDNIQACRFYEKCGFNIKSLTYIYHLSLV